MTLSIQSVYYGSMKRLFQILLMLVVISKTHLPVHAMEWKQGETVTVSKEQNIGSSLIAGGTTIVIDGTVHGDVFCAGKTVTITGIVDGDVLCAAQDLTISGSVTGDVRLAVQTMNVTGTISGNSTVFSQNTTISKSATMSGEVFFAAQTVKTNGNIGPLTGFSNDLEISGVVNGDANIYANSLRMAKDARIFGSLRYTSEKEAMIADGAAVSGIVSHVTPDTDKKSSDKKNIQYKESKSWPSNAVSSVVFYLLLSLIANALFAKKIAQIAQNVEKKWMVSMGVGLLSCIALPFISLFLLVTIIGILLIPVPILVVVVATGFGRIVAAQVFGKSVLEGFKVKQSNTLYLQSLVGIPILFCMFKAPFVGGLFSFISIILGLGAFILSFQKQKAKK